MNRGPNGSRREFLTGAAAFAAGTSLLGCASRTPVDAFPARGGFERLAISYAHVKIGLKTPFSLLHITDTHLTSVNPDESERKRKLGRLRTQTFGGHQEEALADSLAWAKDHVDAVLHTGDLIDFQSEANYALVKKYLGAPPVTFLGNVGNHEYSPEMWMSDPKEENTEAFKDRTRARVKEVYPFDVVLQSTVVNGVNFVTLDDVYAYVTEAQADLFRAEVKKGLPIVLCMHVPVMTDELYVAVKKFWSSPGKRFRSAALPDLRGDIKVQREDRTTAAFLADLRREPLVKAVLTGHSHLNYEERLSPSCVQYVTGGNFLFQGREMLFS